MRRRITVLLVFLVIAVGGLLGVGLIATLPANQDIGGPPDDMPMRLVSFADQTGDQVYGWAIDSADSKGAVLLLHGVKSNRRSMIARARMLTADGYSVLLIDQQAHGESDGRRITFGFREADSVVAAIKFSRARWPQKQLAVIGTSLGGAAAIFAAKRQMADVYVLEAVYSSFRDAVENRLRIRFGEVGAFFAPLLLWQTPLLLGFHFAELSPVDRISDIEAPLLIVAGENDARTTIDDSKRLFKNAGQPKSMWVINQARHQDFYRAAPSEYRNRILGFLKQHLKPQ